MGMQSRKTTMSVAEMRKILGLKKTESYWLIHKNCFKTIAVCGKMRVVIDSFEKWYANQVHYKKVNGEAPGREIRKSTFSVHELSMLLGLNQATIHDLIAREKFTVINLNHHWRIDKEEFNNWYKSQNHYRTIADRKRDRKAEETSMSIPEMGRLLCVDRNAAYNIVLRNSDIVVKNIAGKKRVTRDSFEYWYSNQEHYKKFEDRTPEEQAQILDKHKNDFMGKELRRLYKIEEQSQPKEETPWCTTEKAAEMLAISESAVIRLIRIGELKARKIMGTWHIFNEDIKILLKQHKDLMEDQDDGINSKE